MRHTREKLITLLWPDVDVAGGRHRFSIVLSRLRKLFKQIDVPFSHYITTTREWVMFSAERPFFFDRDHFVSLCKSAEQTNNIHERETNFKSAVQLYKGELLTGIFTEWSETERRHIADLRSRALGQLMHCSMQRQGYEEAVEYGRIIIHEEPLREEAHRALMHCYAAQGRYDLVAQQYHQCLDLVQTELNQYPVADTTKLFREIMEARASQALSSPHTSSNQKQKIQKAFTTFLVAAQHLDAILNPET